MLNELKVNSYFKIISFIIYMFTLLICFDYFGIILLFGILLFIVSRLNVDFRKCFISVYFICFLIFMCFSLHLQFIYFFKVLLVILYFKYLVNSSNCLELDNSFTRVFKYNLFVFFKKYDLFKDMYRFYVKTNISLYGKKKRINALYLSLKYTDNSCSKSYVLRKERKCLYDYLFVIMHFCLFVFVYLLEVYK